MKSHALLETFIVFFDALLAAMWVAMGCVVVVHAMPAELVADSAPVQPSFDIAMPAAQEVEVVASPTPAFVIRA